MRLFLLPISTRRTLIFCERVPHTLPPGGKLPLTDRILDKSSQTWTDWEKAPSGWKRKVTDYGNLLFRRIPFEEWGLKTLPPATARRLREVDEGELKVECLFPGAFLGEERVAGVLEAIARDRQALHRRKLWQSLALMPVTIPFTVVPIIPNLPFFYLCFRAYSHYRALYGGKLLTHLLTKNLIKTTPSPHLDKIYYAGLTNETRQEAREAVSCEAETPSAEDMRMMQVMLRTATREGKDEVPVLRKWNGKVLAEAFRLPEMEVEIERAVEQVEGDVNARQEAETRRVWGGKLPTHEQLPEKAEEDGRRYLEQEKRKEEDRKVVETNEKEVESTEESETEKEVESNKKEGGKAE